VTKPRCDLCGDTPALARAVVVHPRISDQERRAAVCADCADRLVQGQHLILGATGEFQRFEPLDVAGTDLSLGSYGTDTVLECARRTRPSGR
jgi:hypothetical protein